MMRKYWRRPEPNRPPVARRTSLLRGLSCSHISRRRHRPRRRAAIRTIRPPSDVLFKARRIARRRVWLLFAAVVWYRAL